MKTLKITEKNEIEVLPMRIKEVIADIEKCSKNLLETTALLKDVIILLSKPLFIVKKGK
ncbi:MAG: hypothetical protein V3V81_07885 [Candidatus Bathyarchaeia archaeon]